MTEREWLDIGYDKGIIELNKEEEVTFRDAYKKWFVMKMGFNRPPYNGQNRSNLQQILCM